MFSLSQYLADKFPFEDHRRQMEAAYQWSLANPHNRISDYIHHL